MLPLDVRADSVCAPLEQSACGSCEKTGRFWRHTKARWASLNISVERERTAGQGMYCSIRALLSKRPGSEKKTDPLRSAHCILPCVDSAFTDGQRESTSAVASSINCRLASPFLKRFKGGSSSCDHVSRCASMRPT